MTSNTEITLYSLVAQNYLQLRFALLFILFNYSIFFSFVVVLDPASRASSDPESSFHTALRNGAYCKAAPRVRTAADRW